MRGECYWRRRPLLAAVAAGLLAAGCHMPSAAEDAARNAADRRVDATMAAEENQANADGEARMRGAVANGGPGTPD